MSNKGLKSRSVLRVVSKASLVSFIAVTYLFASSGNVSGQQNLPRVSPPSLPQGTPPTLPQVEQSIIEIPITVNLEPLRQQIDVQVPRVISEDDGRDCNEYGVYKHDPVSVSASGSQIRVTVGLVYRVKGFWPSGRPCVGLKGSCGYGEPARRADLIPIITLTWDPAWQIKSSTTVDMNMIDSCDISFVNIDKRELVKEKAMGTPAVQQIPGRIDQELQKIGNVRTIAESAWALFQQPINLGSGAWLIMSPELVGASPINGSGQNISTSIRLVARPRVIIGPKPNGTNTSLPPLEVRDVPGSGFHVALESLLYFDKASQMIESKLINKQYPIGGGTVKVVGVTVSGAGDNVILKVRIRGALNGTVYLTGKIALNAMTNELSARDLHFTVETQEALGQVYQEILNEPAFLRDLTEGAKWQFSEELQSAKSKLQAALNKKYGDVQLRGDILAMRPIGVYAGKDGFQSIVIADGNARIEVP